MELFSSLRVGKEGNGMDGAHGQVYESWMGKRKTRRVGGQEAVGGNGMAGRAID